LAARSTVPFVGFGGVAQADARTMSAIEPVRRITQAMIPRT
jgi:hypothetical protein